MERESERAVEAGVSIHDEELPPEAELADANAD